MLLAVVLGITLGVVGMTLLRQWAEGALAQEPRAQVLTPAAFPHLAPPTRVRVVRHRPTSLVRRAA